MCHERPPLFARLAAPQLLALAVVVLAAPASAQTTTSDTAAAPEVAAASPAPESLPRQAVTAAPAPAGATAAPVAAISRTSSAAPRVPQAEQVAVIEDDGARIEETRRRGQVVHVQVQSKLGYTRSYDIAVKPSAEPASQRGVSGRAAWHLFSF